MSSEKAWCAVHISVHPKGVQWDLGQGSVLSSPTVLASHVFMYLALCTGALSCWNRHCTKMHISGLCTSAEIQLALNIKVRPMLPKVVVKATNTARDHQNYNY